MAKILIVGCGYVGTALAKSLLKESRHEVWGLRRQDVSSIEHPRFHTITCDVNDSDLREQIPASISHVVYCVGAKSRDPDRYRHAYCTGLTHVIEALHAIRAPVERLIFTSSTAVYAQCEGEGVDEDSSADPITWNGKILKEAETIALESGFSSVVLRLAGIYGPTRTSFMQKVLRGEASSSAAYTNRIHRDDCAGALSHLLFLDSPEFCYLGVDEEPATRLEVTHWLRNAMQQRGLRAAEPRHEEKTMSLNKQCSSVRLRHSGYCFRFPSYREGYSALLDEFIVAQ